MYAALWHVVQYAPERALLPTRFIDALFGVHMFEFVMRYTSQQTSMIAISSLDFARIKAEPVYSLKAFGKVNASKTSAALKTAIIIVNSFAACTLSGETSLKINC